MTFGDVIILGILASVIAAVIVNMLRKKKSGKTCGCASCEGCAMAGKCHVE